MTESHFPSNFLPDLRFSFFFFQNQEISTHQSDIFSLGLLIFYIISYGEHAFAPSDIPHTSSMVKDNILNNNYDFHVRLDLKEIDLHFEENDKDGEKHTPFENLDIDERINHARDQILPKKLEILLKNLVNLDANNRMKVEKVRDELKKYHKFCDFYED